VSSGPTDARPPFRFSATTRVGFDETDAQGVVYYGRYMPYFDRARVEYWRHLAVLHEPASGTLVMRANRVEYHAPARFDDLLEVFMRVEHIGTTSMTFDLAAYGEDGTLLCTARQTLVQIDPATRRPVAVPESTRGVVAAFEGHEVGRAAPAAAGDDDEPRRAGTVEAVERIVADEGEADEILRATVEVVAKRLRTFCGIRFVEGGERVPGPAAGGDARATEVVPVAYDGATVAEVVLGARLADGERAALERIAALLAPYCLVGWDTGGETWQA
jgi:YbgC/YbaW family acyl-CoA thioester hydrolase